MKWNKEELYDKIDAYLRGELPIEEAMEIERIEAHHPELRREMELQELEWETLEAFRNAPPPEAEDQPRWYWMMSAFAVAFTVGAFSVRQAGKGQKEK